MEPKCELKTPYREKKSPSSKILILYDGFYEWRVNTRSKISLVIQSVTLSSSQLLPTGKAWRTHCSVKTKQSKNIAASSNWWGPRTIGNLRLNMTSIGSWKHATYISCHTVGIPPMDLQIPREDDLLTAPLERHGFLYALQLTTCARLGFFLLFVCFNLKHNSKNVGEKKSEKYNI